MDLDRRDNSLYQTQDSHHSSHWTQYEPEHWRTAGVRAWRDDPDPGPAVPADHLPAVLRRLPAGGRHPVQHGPLGPPLSSLGQTEPCGDPGAGQRDGAGTQGQIGTLRILAL